MTAATRRPTPRRVRPAHIDLVQAELSERDWKIALAVNRLRVVTGQQLERLCFGELGSEHSRTVTRSRVLARLVRNRVLVSFGRQVGGRGRGSTVSVYALDTAGHELMRRRQLAEAQRVRVRRPGVPSQRALHHTVAVSELYVQLIEQAPAVDGVVAAFRAVPGSWWPNGLGGFVKPDAYLVLRRGDVSDHWWAEVDLATESLPVVRSKIRAYLDFRERGVRGPDGVLPWLLIATISAKRRTAIAGLLRQLPEAAELVSVVELGQAAQRLLEVLRE